MGTGKEVDVAGIANMSDRDILIKLATDQEYLRSDVIEIKEHAAATNGHIASLKAEQYKQEGRLQALSWLGRMSVAGIGTGAALAGVILTIVARGMWGMSARGRER